MDDDGKKVLIVDDDPVILKLLKEAFNIHWPSCTLTLSSDVKNARWFIENKFFDIFVFDINLPDGRGIDLLKLVKDRRITKPVVFLSGSEDDSEDCYKEGASLFVYKGEGSFSSPDFINSLKGFFVDNPFLAPLVGYKDRISIGTVDINRDEFGKSVGIEFTTKRKGGGSKFVVYRLLYHPKNCFTIAIASCIGCRGGCKICGSCENPFIRGFSKEELLAQVYHGINSCLGHEVFLNFPNKVKIRINFTCEGDALLFNLKNTLSFIREIKEILPRDTEIIVTSSGGYRLFRRVLKKHREEMRGVKIYWSLNFLNEEMRHRIMPITSRDSIAKTMKILSKTKELIGTISTVSVLGLGGMNREDILKIKNLLEGTEGEFNLKIQGLRYKGSDSELICLAPSKDELVEFYQLPDWNEVPFTTLKLVMTTGFFEHSSCGSTCRRKK